MTSALRRRSDPEARTDGRLTAFVDAVVAADGVAPFNEASLLGESELTLVTDGANVVGVVMTAEEIEFAVHPDARGRGLGTELLLELLPSGRAFWAHGDLPAAAALAAAHGLSKARTLLQLHGPVAGPRPWTRDDLELSTFRPGVDDDDWVELNARTFADHPEQGAINRETLQPRLYGDGKHPEDFLLVRAASGELVGYCWLKLEDADHGEIYVLGVAPEHAGEGIGGALLDAGLARLGEHGIGTATLYVEGDNTPAVGLYRSRGFVDHAVDVLYRRSPSVYRSP